MESDDAGRAADIHRQLAALQARPAAELTIEEQERSRRG